MKKFVFILSFLFVSSVSLFAQEETEENEGNEKIRDKMREYIQKRLDLSKDEADKFTPLFIRYFKEWRQTLRDNRDLPPLDRQQKVVDLQLRYRTQFREVVGEDRGNKVFDYQKKFIIELQRLRNQRLQNNPNQPVKRQRVGQLL
jgi:hypothetical protein